ncbi:hypothetical protein Tco_0504711 [Tanacetum coccineum]
MPYSGGVLVTLKISIGLYITPSEEVDIPKKSRKPRQNDKTEHWNGKDCALKSRPNWALNNFNSSIMLCMTRPVKTFFKAQS